MSFSPILRHRAAPFVALTAAAALYPKGSLHAESPETTSTLSRRKPIYDTSRDSEPSALDVHLTTVSSDPPTPPVSSRPTPTARLAEQVKQTRLFLHHYAAALEDGVNNTMTRFLRLESDFTSTVASLAPPKESGEKVVPGAVYVLVAAMAGSIITRRSNILLRATVPVAAGIGCSYTVLPLTTRNVGNLVWTYEEKYPVIADTHLRIKDRITRFIETGKAHSQMGLAMAEDKVQGVRDSVEGWVKQGK